MAYTYSLVAPSPPWLSITTVNSQGVITGDKNQVPATGYQGTYRVRVWDGASEAFIQGPIDIGPRVNAGGESLYQIDYQQSESIAWGVAVGGGFGDVDSGGGTTTGDFENMAFNFSATGALLSTKPTAAGTEGEVRHEARKETFSDQSFLGGTDTRITVSGVGVIDCTIKRSAIWQYSTAAGGGFSGEWFLVNANPIEIEVTAIDGNPPIELPLFSPRLLGLKADAIEQIAYIKHYQPSSTYEVAGSARWVAFMTTNSLAVPVGASGAPYWDWGKANQDTFIYS
jgi:hypothetical protein